MILGFLDPYVLACPTELDGEKAIVAYVERLVAWGDLKREGWIQFVLPRTASETLAETNGFPPWGRLNEALAHVETGVQQSDVFEIMNAFLTKCPTVEDLAQIEEILLENVVCRPPYTEGRQQIYRLEYERFLGLIRLLRARDASQTGGRQLLTADAPCPHEVDFSGTLIDIQIADQGRFVADLPMQIEDRILGVCCPRVSRKEADCLSLWEAAVDQCDFQAVIGLYTLLKAIEFGGSVPSWRIGALFAPSVKNMNLRSRAAGKRVLRACSETILGSSMEAVHAIRISEGGGAGPLRRGNDGAFRRDIDHDLHLHYWETREGPELASVVSHNDMTIPR